MNMRYREQMERAFRVLVFCRDHPSDLTGGTTEVRALADRLTRTERAVQGARGSILAAREADAECLALRTRIAFRLQVLATMACTAGEESLGTPIVIACPLPEQGQVEFLQGARLAVVAAREREPLLAKHGLPEGHLDALSNEIEQFAGRLAQRDQADLARVELHRELGTSIREIANVLHQLHAIMTFRYRDEPARLRAWATAIDLRVEPHRRASLTPPGTAQGHAA